MLEAKLFDQVEMQPHRDQLGNKTGTPCSILLAWSGNSSKREIDVHEIPVQVQQAVGKIAKGGQSQGISRANG
jgi:hypothetical protein